MKNLWLLAWDMTLRQIFIRNFKELRKKEGISQMKLSEYCNTSPGYIAEIESGRKFPSPEMIDKIAKVLRIAPHLFFINQKDASDSDKTIPSLPYTVKKQIEAKIKKQMKAQISTQINTQVNAHVKISLKEIFSEVKQILDRT